MYLTPLSRSLRLAALRWPLGATEMERKYSTSLFGVVRLEIGGAAQRPSPLDEVNQVLRGRPVAINRVQRGAPHVLVETQPALAKFGDRDRFKA
jgi:hypothetical protein